MSTLTFATYKKAHKTNTLVFSYAPIFFNILTFSVFFAAGGLLLVGAAPVFKEQDKGWHSVFAIICAVFATLWQFLHCQFREVLFLPRYSLPSHIVQTRSSSARRFGWSKSPFAQHSYQS